MEDGPATKAWGGAEGPGARAAVVRVAGVTRVARPAWTARVARVAREGGQPLRPPAVRPLMMLRWKTRKMRRVGTDAMASAAIRTLTGTPLESE